MKRAHQKLFFQISNSLPSYLALFLTNYIDAPPPKSKATITRETAYLFGFLWRQVRVYVQINIDRSLKSKVRKHTCVKRIQLKLLDGVIFV